MKLTVSMITMNEAGAVAKVIGDIRRVVPDAEILLVDSSRDRTAEIAQELGCRVIRQFPPQGYGPAMDRAVREASGDVVVTLDCDDTYPVEMIPRLVQLVEGGADLVNTTRVWKRPPAMPLANFLANRFFALMARVLLGLKTTDMHSGMRAYRKTMIDAVQWNPRGPALPVDMIAIPFRRGFKVVDVRIDYHERIGQTTLNRFESTVWTFKRLWKARRAVPSPRSAGRRWPEGPDEMTRAAPHPDPLPASRGEGTIVVAVLCGGLGTRLGELTRDVPKPMIEIGGRPYLERVLESFAERGLRDFVLLTGYRGEVIEEHFGDGGRFGVRIRYSREDEPLGTGGAIREARHLLGERFLMTYADVLRRFDYDRFVRQHQDNCLAVYPRILAGNADLEADRVVRFDKRAPELPYIDAGFSILRRETIDILPPAGACSFEEIVFSGLAQHGELAGEIVSRDFFDIGTPEELARTREALER